MKPTVNDRTLAMLLGVVSLAIAVSAIGSHDLVTWAMEAAPAIIAVCLLWIGRRRWPFTPLLLGLIALHCIVLVIGAHYTYEFAPPGEWLKSAMGWKRNDYDRIGHFFQGFVPVLVAREVIMRRTTVRSVAMLATLSFSVAMCVSALYEILEMTLDLVGGNAMHGFVDPAGDPMDSNWDMTMCMIGSITSLVLFWRLHNRQLKARGVDL